MQTMKNNIPIVYILFGSTGDLAQKKILPALLSLFTEGNVPKGSKIIAFSRRQWSDLDYKNFIQPALSSIRNFSEADIENFLQHIIHVEGTFDNSHSFKLLQEKLDHIDASLNTETQKLYHLSVQPDFYLQIIKGLYNVELTQSQTSKFLIEKPFGFDLESAVELQKNLEKYLSEKQLYRIDHYLGKSGLWNILHERMTNSQLEKKLHAQNIRSIHVRLLETIDVGDRGEFYDSVGAIRDVLQNHMLEMLAYLIMDLPQQTMAGLETARAHALELLTVILDKEHVFIGQYNGYRGAFDVKPDSIIETYAKIILNSSNSRWQGVPLILETGKALSKKKTEVEVLFTDLTQKIFSIDEARDAYKEVISAAIYQNLDYFVSLREVLAEWRLITPVLKLKESGTLPLGVYTPGKNP